MPSKDRRNNWVPSPTEIASSSRTIEIASELETKGMQLEEEAMTMLEQAGFYRTLATLLRGE